MIAFCRLCLEGMYCVFTVTDTCQDLAKTAISVCDGIEGEEIRHMWPAGSKLIHAFL
jgi:hypothetical protein